MCVHVIAYVCIYIDVYIHTYICIYIYTHLRICVLLACFEFNLALFIIPFQLWLPVAPPGRFPFHANQVTGSAGRAGRFTEGWVSKVSNSFLFLREGAGREWHDVAP